LLAAVFEPEPSEQNAGALNSYR